MVDLLLLFTLCMISAQVSCDDAIKVKGYSGGSVIITYRYKSHKYSNHTKYFCKVQEGKCTNILPQTDRTLELKGKFFATDEMPAGVYSVLLRHLNQEDAGNYRCGVDKQRESHLDVELDVENGVYYGKSFSQTTHPGDTVTFTCTYPDRDINDMISVYKVTSQGIYAIIFTYTEYEEKDRYVLSISIGDKVINMSISNVMVEDGGLYLCGVSQKEASYVIIFSEMQLQVTAPGSSVIIITVCIGVALLLIAGFVLIFYKLWSTKTKDASSPADRGIPENRDVSEDRENEREEKGADCAYYEKIPDTQCNTVYYMAQKPKPHQISPDQPFYSMVQRSKTEAYQQQQQQQQQE